MAEGCLPGIDTIDMMGVFEEHRIMNNMEHLDEIISEVTFKVTALWSFKKIFYSFDF